jgi:hypothetical protein
MFYVRHFAIALLASLAALGTPAALHADDAGEFAKLVVPFLQKHCVACHGPKKQESSLRLDMVSSVDFANRNLWTLVHDRVASGEMPPPNRTQPADAEKKQILASIHQRQRSLGVGGARRLNRRELAASLRDVTGMGIDFAMALPADGLVAGFDTGTEGLLEASDGVAQWLAVTRRAVDGIRFLEPEKSKAIQFDLRTMKDLRRGSDSAKGDMPTIRGATTFRPGEGHMLPAGAVGDRDTLNILLPVGAARQSVVRFTVVASSFKPMEGLPTPHLWVQAGGKDLDYRPITAAAETPQRLVYEVHLGDLAIQKGLSIHLSNKVEIPYAVPGFENEDKSSLKDPPPGGTGLFRPAFDRRTTPVDKQPTPFVLLHSIEIEPEVVLKWPPAEWKADLGTIADDAASAQKLLALWIRRAWRRPVSDAEQVPFRKLYEKVRADGGSFDEALRAAFQSILLSAPFRYQASPANPSPMMAQHAVASRLGFMLTGSPPDAELLKLAEAGKLKEPKILDAQVDRLLADPRSQAFIRPFVMQWLLLDQPITIAQDHIQKQDFRFARYLKASMREETIAYISALIAENRPARELVDSDWTMMNDALAMHYGYPPLNGGELRKVKLKADDPRGGGILGHAGIQSMLCWMGENWLIYRGAWALRHILDMPPPPPPLEVPELNPSDGKNKGKSFRELLVQHQADSRCSVCHKNIDPVGFAFQNFDISGRWRDVEFESYKRGELDGRVSWVGVGKTRPVDAAGTMPRGEDFKSFGEFKKIVADKYQVDMVRGLMKNLMVYATGRIPGIDDRIEIAGILEKHAPQGYPLRDLIKAVVRSRAFSESSIPVAEAQPSTGRSSR